MQYEDSGALPSPTDNIALGAAMLDADRKLFGITPAWGLLTGVRPQKSQKNASARADDKSTTRELAAKCLINPKRQLC